MNVTASGPGSRRANRGSDAKLADPGLVYAGAALAALIAGGGA